MIEKLFYLNSTNPNTSFFEISLEPAIYIDRNRINVFLSCLEIVFNNKLYDDTTNTTAMPYIFVNCSLSNTTSSLNGKPTNIVECITITDERIIRHVNVNPIPVDCSTVIGSVVDKLSFWLTDPNNNIIALPDLYWRGKMLLTIE